MRRVADRYLPKVVSQRQKWGFPVSAFDRMQIRPEFFANSFVVNNFKLSDEKFSYLFEGEGLGLKIRLLMLDIWGQMFIQGETRDRIQERLSQYVIIP